MAFPVVIRFFIAILYGRTGCLTAHIGGCRPGQYPPTTLTGVGEPTVWVGDEGGVGTRDEVVDAPYRVSTWFSTQARLAAGGGVISLCAYLHRIAFTAVVEHAPMKAGTL